MKFGTKIEIFAPEAQNPNKAEEAVDHTQNNQGGNQPQRSESTASEEENRKMYTALLQNQVLGIDNPYLLHEIHNRDEMGEKDNLYSYQMQREGSAEVEDAEDMNENGGSKKKSQNPQSSSQMHDSSPFNSKYTVLKFNGKSPNQSSMTRPSPHPKYRASGLGSADVTPVKRGLFSNASNYTPIQESTNQGKTSIHYQHSPYLGSAQGRYYPEVFSQNHCSPIMNFGGGIMASPSLT